MANRWHPEPLAADHELGGFDCGVPVLNQWLIAEARRAQAADTARTYVWADESNDVVAYYSETAEEFVRRRHRELQARGRRNAEIWTVVADELAHRPVAPGAISERRLRRLVYG